MIQVQSWLRPSDNSGASYVECIKTLGGFNRKFSYPGDFLLVSIKKLRFLLNRSKSDFWNLQDDRWVKRKIISDPKP